MSFKDYYEAGAASRQGEVDELRSQLDAAEEMIDMINAELIKNKHELQKRIDEALVEIEEYYYTDGMSDLVFSDIAIILKGNQND